MTLQFFKLFPLPEEGERTQLLINYVTGKLVPSPTPQRHCRVGSDGCASELLGDANSGRIFEEVGLLTEDYLLLSTPDSYKMVPQFCRP